MSFITSMITDCLSPKKRIIESSAPPSTPTTPTPTTPNLLRIRIPVTQSCAEEECSEFRVIKQNARATLIWFCDNH